MSKAYKENPGTTEVPRDEHGPLIRNHTNKTFGEFTVIGYHGYSDRTHMAGGRELFDDERDLWTVRCKCGLYYIKDDGYVKRQLLHNKRNNRDPAVCAECRRNK